MKESRSSQKQNLSGLIVLLLFGVFAVCILAVLLSGTGIYDRLTRRDAETFDTRSAVQYLATRVHQAEGPGSLSIRQDAENGSMLSIVQAYGEDQYETLLYCRDGWLCELFEEIGAEVDLEAGERILPVSRLEGSLENGLLTLLLTDENGIQSIRLLVRGEEAHP